jgi:hypothetical protein
MLRLLPWWLRPGTHKARAPRTRTTVRYRPVLETLEDRQLLSTFLVTNTGDNSGVNPASGAGTGTFRQALVDANSNPGMDSIEFNIPLQRPGR